MTESSSQKIDAYTHILPPKYKELLFSKAKGCYYLEADSVRPALFDLDSSGQGHLHARLSYGDTGKREVQNFFEECRKNTAIGLLMRFQKKRKGTRISKAGPV